MRANRVVLVMMSVAACGGGGDKKIDAAQIFDDVPVVDTPPPPPGCDWGELADATNDWNTGTPEQTNLVFDGSKPLVICGKIDNGHFDMNEQRIDVDAYFFTVANEGDIELIVTPGADTSAIESVAGYVSDQNSLYATAVVFDHGIASTHLQPGNYELDMEAYSATNAAAAIDYKLKVVADMPLTRCPKVTAAASYTEANDGAGNVGNDVFSIVYTPSYMVTETPANDLPENTNITVAGDTKYRITGTHALVDGTDEYMDRDAYKITTGATTNQLAIRLNWPGTTADLDYILFNESQTSDVGGGTSIGNEEDEFATFAVKPNTTYWLWVGMYDGSTAPVTYDVSVCGENFTAQ
jgi:hypothetical protein